jgi:predicted aminopeptidase
MKLNKKKLMWAILIGIAALIAVNYNLISYALNMGYHQLKIVHNARPLSEVLNDTTVADSIKVKIRFIQEVRHFAIDSLGLSDTDNYTELFDQGGKPILWNLSACKPYEFSPKEWSFPIAGKFPYKGFFNLENAKEEAKDLKDEFWDTRIYSVSAWSTLGWFKDPILSNMLFRSEGSLAETIIHEMTHATLYIKDNAEYNENLAQFVGEEGARRFLINKFGDESKIVKKYLNEDGDYQKFVQHILNGTKLLDTLYNKSEFKVKADSVKKIEKYSLIKKIILNVDTISFFSKDDFAMDTLYLPNNAFFMSYRRYHAQSNTFKDEFIKSYNANFKQYFAFLREKYGYDDL